MRKLALQISRKWFIIFFKARIQHIIRLLMFVNEIYRRECRHAALYFVYRTTDWINKHERISWIIFTRLHSSRVYEWWMLFFEVWSRSFENHNDYSMFICRVCVNDKYFFLKLQARLSTKSIIMKHHKFCFVTADFLILMRTIKTQMFVICNFWKTSIQFSRVIILIFFFLHYQTSRVILVSNNFWWNRLAQSLIKM